MLIESWIAVMITVGIFILCAIALVGWIKEGEKLQMQIRENKALREENKRLAKRIAHRNAIENIKVANEYFKSKEN